MNDLRTQLPECPLEYQIPHIPGSHTALVIEINAAAIDWQERMLPWTLASLINNTDLVMKGVHLYIVCEEGTQDRIKNALKRFDLPPGTIHHQDSRGEVTSPLPLFGKHGYAYDSVCLFDVNYWAFRGVGKAQDRADNKLPFGHVLRQTWGWAAAEYSFHIANDIDLKDTWVRMSEALYLIGRDSLSRKSPDPDHRDGVLPTRRESIRDYLVDASARAKWLHTANTAAYGEDYKKQNRNVAAYFFNEADPNWHLDASILQYSAREVNTYFTEWAAEWKPHLGTEALIALYLLKTGQHAHNLADSVIIESSYVRAEYARLCNMRFADVEAFLYATRELRGAHLNISMN